MPGCSRAAQPAARFLERGLEGERAQRSGRRLGREPEPVAGQLRERKTSSSLPKQGCPSPPGRQWRSTSTNRRAREPSEAEATSSQIAKGRQPSANHNRTSSPCFL